MLPALVAALVLPASMARPGGAAPAARNPRTAASLPDTVLAMVGEARTVGVGAFRSAWAQLAPPARPDSLTPQAARQFLDLLIDKEVLAERATRETWEWTARESAQVASLRDRLMMRMALDSALAAATAARAQRGEPALEAEALGVAVRESTVAGLAATFDEALVARLARAFAALPRPSADSLVGGRIGRAGSVPAIERADSSLVLARSQAGAYTVAQMLDAWKKLDPLFRPRIETPEQVRDLVRNGLFERALRRDAARHHLDRHARVREALERQREYLAVQYFVAREVYARIPTDGQTLRRHYDRDPEAWAVPTRLRIVRLLLANRREAVGMAVRLRAAAAAETLVARGRRQGADYLAEITAQSDSALFAAALSSGTGTVLGPDSVGGGWQVVRVEAVLPAGRRAFERVREQVLRDWSEEEGERRLQALLATLRKRTRVVVNEPALAELAKDGARPDGRRGQPAERP